QGAECETVRENRIDVPRIPGSFLTHLRPVQPSLRDESQCAFPGVETPGYSQRSLRDQDTPDSNGRRISVGTPPEFGDIMLAFLYSEDDATRAPPESVQSSAAFGAIRGRRTDEVRPSAVWAFWVWAASSVRPPAGLVCRPPPHAGHDAGPLFCPGRVPGLRRSAVSERSCPQPAATSMPRR
ncbi:MAG: hypothetical protein ACI8V5_003630, partial [Limisphaerales bacterium]